MGGKDKKKLNKSAMLWLFKKVKNRLPALIAVIVFTVIGSLLGVTFALATKGVIDSAASGQMGKFIWASVVLLALITGMVLCNFLSSFISTGLSAYLDRDLKKKMMHRILNSDYKQISKYKSGELVHRLNVDVGNIVNGLLNVSSNFSALIVRTIAVVAVLVTMSPLFTFAMIVLCLIVGGFYYLMRHLIREYNMKINKASAKISGFLQEITEKLLIVKALGVKQVIESKEEWLLEHRWLIQKKYRKFSIGSSTAISILSYCISFVALVWCAYQLLLGNMTFGSLTAMTTLVSQLTVPVFMLPTLINQIIGMSASAERLREIENIEEVSDTYKYSVDDVYPKMKQIEASNLSFAYDRDEVVRDVNFDIPKDKMTVIMGSSGIGKSTILKILLGIYKADKGQISFVCGDDKYAISECDKNIFSYVPQDNLLLSGTIRDNLTLVKPDASDEELQQALFVSAMDDYVYDLPDALDTELGENGSGLSEGQAQRLSLARAILSDSPILLLDEVTSALDAKTEQIVLNRIRELKDRTCIVVTHRPAVLDIADYLLKVGSDKISAKSL